MDGAAPCIVDSIEYGFAEYLLTEVLTKRPMLLTFLVIGQGYLIENIRIGPIDKGATTGILITGLLLGQLGFPSSSAASTLGFALLIFSVGIIQPRAKFGISTPVR